MLAAGRLPNVNDASNNPPTIVLFMFLSLRIQPRAALMFLNEKLRTGSA